MLIRCPSCGKRSPDGAAYCIACGAALHVLAPAARRRARAATGATTRLPARRTAPLSRAAWLRALPVAGLLFTVIFMLGMAHYLALAWRRPLGFWLVVVLVSGALVAQRAWLDGQLWRGLCGMALWGGMIWLLAVDRAVPWGAALLLGWVLLRPLGYLLAARTHSAMAAQASQAAASGVLEQR
jgi:hypothetical protein